MLKSQFLDSIVSTSGAKARKCFESELLGLILSTSGAKGINVEIGTLCISFVDFWSQVWKMLKSEVLGPTLSTSGGKAGKTQMASPYQNMVTDDSQMDPGWIDLGIYNQGLYRGSIGAL